MRHQFDRQHLGTEIADVTKSAADHADQLAHIADTARVALDDVFRDSPADELRSRATRLEGTVVHGLVVLASLGLLAGRLYGLAWIRSAARDDEETS